MAKKQLESKRVKANNRNSQNRNANGTRSGYLLKFFIAVVVALVGVLIAAMLGNKEPQLDSCPTANFNAQMYSAKDAFVVGYTGECGRELVRHLVDRKVFKRLVLIGRREVELPNELQKFVEQKVVDFDNLNASMALFAGLEVGFCCLGTTRAKSGADGFVKIDHDYVLNTARVAKAAGCKHFNLITASGSNKDSFFLYPQTKGLVEKHVGELGFPRYSIFRPAFLLCDRRESRLMEVVAHAVLTPVAALAPTLLTVPTTTVGKAMVVNMFKTRVGTVEVYENAAIHMLGAEFDKCFENRAG